LEENDKNYATNYNGAMAIIIIIIVVDLIDVGVYIRSIA